MTPKLFIHGSILTRPLTASDIDVIASSESIPQIEAIVRYVAALKGWRADLPIDVKYGTKVPRVPFSGEVPVLQVATHDSAVEAKAGSFWFAQPLYKTCFDLAAWAHACDKNDDARAGFVCALRAKPIDTRQVSDEHPRVVLVTTDTQYVSPYHGGGPEAMRNARRKAGAGWEFCFNQLPEPARRLVEAVMDGCEMPHWFEKVRHGSPQASNGEYMLIEEGCFASYADGYCW